MRPPGIPLIRALRYVMFVQVEQGEVPVELDARAHPSIGFLRVRYPLPACVRMRVMRPAVVVLGRTLRGRDLGVIVGEAFRMGASVFHLGSIVERDELVRWLERLSEVAAARRPLSIPPSPARAFALKTDLGSDFRTDRRDYAVAAER